MTSQVLLHRRVPMNDESRVLYAVVFCFFRHPLHMTCVVPSLLETTVALCVQLHGCLQHVALFLASARNCADYLPYLIRQLDKVNLDR